MYLNVSTLPPPSDVGQLFDADQLANAAAALADTLMQREDDTPSGARGVLSADAEPEITALTLLAVADLAEIGALAAADVTDAGRRIGRELLRANLADAAAGGRLFLDRPNQDRHIAGEIAGCVESVTTMVACVAAVVAIALDCGRVGEEPQLATVGGLLAGAARPPRGEISLSTREDFVRGLLSQLRRVARTTAGGGHGAGSRGSSSGDGDPEGARRIIERLHRIVRTLGCVVERRRATSVPGEAAVHVLERLHASLLLMTSSLRQAASRVRVPAVRMPIAIGS